MEGERWKVDRSRAWGAQVALSPRLELDLDARAIRGEHASSVASLNAAEPAGPSAAVADAPDRPASDLRGLLEAYEKSVILAALGVVGGRQRSAAELLRILPSTLHEKMKRLGIRPQR